MKNSTNLPSIDYLEQVIKLARSHKLESITIPGVVVIQNSNIPDSVQESSSTINEAAEDDRDGILYPPTTMAELEAQLIGGNQ